MEQSDKFATSNLYAFIDLFLLLLIVVFHLVNPPEIEGIIIPKAEAQLIVEWSSDRNVDVDTWIRLPNKDIVSFNHKDAKSAVLRRDDLGTDIYTPGDNISTVAIPQNIEIVDFVKLVDGTYVINLQMYNMKSSIEPVEVSVSFIIMDPYSLVAEETTTLTHRGHETTLFSIKIKNGKAVSINTDAKITIATKRKR